MCITHEKRHKRDEEKKKKKSVEEALTVAHTEGGKSSSVQHFDVGSLKFSNVNSVHLR